MEVILYILKGARASPNGEVRESKHEMKPGQTVPARAGDPTADKYHSWKQRTRT
jgi:hypothetical protein